MNIIQHCNAIIILLVSCNMMAMKFEQDNPEDKKVDLSSIQFTEGMTLCFGHEDEPVHYEIVADARNKKLIGYVKISAYNPCHIYSLFVDESVRNKGIGQMLLTRAVIYSKKNGCTEVQGKIWQHMADYYQKLGAFVQCHKMSDFCIHGKCLPVEPMCDVRYKIPENKI